MNKKLKRVEYEIDAFLTFSNPFTWIYMASVMVGMILADFAWSLEKFKRGMRK